MVVGKPPMEGMGSSAARYHPLYVAKPVSDWLCMSWGGEVCAEPVPVVALSCPREHNYSVNSLLECT